MNTSRSNSGFSLIEVLCAILILGVGLAGLVQGVTTALSSSKDSEIQTTVALLAAGQMETLRADGFLVPGEKSGECSDPFSRFRWRQSVERTALDGLYTVTVTIEQSSTGKSLFELKTQLFDAPTSANDSQDGGGAGGRKRKPGGARR